MKPPWRVALVRHPRPQVAQGVCYGRLDLAVHSDAAAQIAAAVATLQTFAAARIWSSPALRCQALAHALSLALATPIRHDTRLLEMNFGDWEGLAWNDIPRDALDRWAADPHAFAPPGGESGADLIARTAGFHRQIAVHREPCIVVAHAGPLKILEKLLTGADIDLMAPSMPIAGIEIITAPKG